MASFSVDITQVIFSATNAGYKDITITGMPQAGVNCTITGTNDTSFGFRIPGDDQNVYRVYTTSHTNIGTNSNEKTATFKITNLSDSTDYVEVSLVQPGYYGYPSVSGVKNVYDNIYAFYSDGFGDARIFAEYRTDNSGTYSILYVDGYEGTTTLSESWAYYTADSAYTDTGFKQIKIGAINNSDTAFRKCNITFPGEGGTGNTSYLYQNAYPGSKSGCTSPTIFTKDGGTERVTLNHSSQNVANLSAYTYYTNDGLTYTISKSKGSNYETYWDITLPANEDDYPKSGAIMFQRDSTNEIFGFTIVRQDPSSGPISTLTVDPTVLTYPASGGARVLDVTYSGTLTISEFPSWITYETVNVDTTHRSYTITASKNSSTSSRNFDIEISNGTDTVTVPVTQSGAEAASLTISPTGASVGSAAGTTTVTVTSTGIDKVECSIEEGWVSLKTQSSNVYTFSYTANTTSNKRSCIITFYGGGLSKTFLINQAAGAISVSPVSSNVGNTSGTIQVTVTGSSNITYSISGSWLTYQSKSGNVYTFAYTENSSSSQRTATVTFSASGMTDEVFTLTQDAASAPASLTISPTSNSVSSSSGSVQITVTSSGISDVQYSISDSWITYGGKSGNVYTFNYSSKTSTGQRTGTITFSGGGITEIYRLTQAGTSVDVLGSLKVYPKKLRYYGEGGSIRVSFTNRPEGGIDYEITYTDGSGWLSVGDSGPNKYVSATKNSGIRRRASIRFYDANDRTNYVIVQVIQGNIDGYNSIWMDDLYYPESRDDNGNYYYRLVNHKNNAEYFEGVSTKPINWGGEIGGIDIPRLIDGHLYSLLLSGSSSDWSDMFESYLTVDIYNMTENGYPGVVDATFKYYNDWSRFEKRYDYTRSLNDPINGKGCDNMIIPFCVYYDDAATFSIVDTEKNGNVNTYTLSKPSTPFAMRTNSFYDTKKLEYKQDNKVIFSYDMDHCGPGAFIYRNRFGGWDSFLIEGNIIKTDNYTKLNWRRKGEYNQGYSINTLKYIDEKVTDSVNVDTTYQAYTGWLSDEEAERLVFHLLSSPIVYFQNLHKENQVFDTDPLLDLIPIRITTSSAEYKKFRNGKKLINYLITFEKSNTEKVRD